ncbi:HD-GYP domain-containing protein [Arcobacter sp. CECT 8985]|uniref:HD-GYP domain-containing protein n=1 Tax=Arcobacter sp. CECT 8985 TaxID=1935424 RepID=UPI00100A425F|nr:HD domain-containing phosphohydrolase [Arcobacter sp. CECT 8985]RXJ86658.1 HD family phosphohydrolase [Arcobacter sp. CECT 8985]
MKFNLNQFLLALSDALDFVEINTLGSTSFHSKRVAYIALRLADFYILNKKEKFDLCSFSILHDNGLAEEVTISKFEQDPKNENHSILEQNSKHCHIGEKNIKGFPFLSEHKDIVKYHHENFDGSGFFKLKDDQIPLLAQIIALADTVDNIFHFETPTIENRQKIIRFINDKKNILYSEELVNNFNFLANKTSFWLDLQSSNLEKLVLSKVENFTMNIELEHLVKLSSVFTTIIDSNSAFTSRHSSGLSNKVEKMSYHYNYSSEKIMKLIIAANLHDLGKLAVPNKILDKQSALTKDEFEIIKCHTYYTRQALQKVNGFEDIVEWASNHHEKLDGNGYPYGFDAKRLCFDSRLMTCLDIYQALTEDRPYRKGMSHTKTMEILKEQASKGYIDSTIVNDIHKVFS